MAQGKLTDYDDNSSTDTPRSDDTEQEESTGSADVSERRDIPSPGDAQTVREPPQIDSDGVPDKCISLTVESTWGHFKRVGRSNTKQTYRIPPRTTVAGLLASIVGSDRDSYYDVFAPDTSAIAITPLCDIRTINIPVTELGTDPGQSCVQKETSNNGVTLAYQDTTEPRQLHAYEVIADPKYRIDVAVEDADYYDELATKLENGESHYPPALGRSEYLCSISNVDVTTSIERVTGTDTYSIDSIVPVEFSDVIPQQGVTYDIERSPAIMTAARNGRKTTRFDDYVYTRNTDETVKVSSDVDIEPVTVGDRTVVFR